MDFPHMKNKGGPNVAIVVQHAEDTPPFMRALHFEAMHAPKFPEYSNMVSGCLCATQPP